MTQVAMTSPPDVAALRETQSQIEGFIRSAPHVAVVEDEEMLFELSAARWKLSIEFGKLLFEVWNDARTIGRRVEEVAYRDRGRLGLFVRKPGARETATLELRELTPAGEAHAASRARGRLEARQALLAFLTREYRSWHFERVSNRSDREHTFSAWYTRGLTRQGRSGWAFLALAPDEPPGAADAALAHGLIWLDWLRAHVPEAVVPRLCLFLPPSAIAVTAHRAAFLNHRALQIEIHEWTPDAAAPRPVDTRDFGNVETHLVPRRHAEALVERFREHLRAALGHLFDQVELMPDPTCTFVSVRVRGLEVARIEGQITPRISFGVEGERRPMPEEHPEELRRWVAEVLRLRRARGLDSRHPCYRLQAERWLESLLLRDITRLDPAFLPDTVYPQVPAFAGQDRGVIDILAVTRGGRLAVIELKLEEDPNLPFQALDYWLRVKWLAERKAFAPGGYFRGVELSSAPPRLYLVCPAFRYHSTTHRMLRYLDLSIEIVQVGLNAQWREKIQVLFRREKQRVAQRS